MTPEERLKRSQLLKEQTNRLEYQTFAEFWGIVETSASILKEIEPGKRRLWLEHVIREIYEKQNGLCALCGEPVEYEDLHVDHIIPFSLGGGNERGNLQIAHPLCNKRKGKQVDPYALLSYLEDRFMNLSKTPQSRKRRSTR